MIRVPIFLFSFFLLFSTSLFAQERTNTSELTVLPTYQDVKKGTFTFSLNGSAHNSKNIAGLSLTPQAGYVVADRLVLGLQLSVTNRFSKKRPGWLNLKAGDVREYAFTPEVYVRYYILPFRFTPFIQGSSGYNFAEFSSNTFNGEKFSINTNKYVAFGAVGISLRTGKNLGLQALYNIPIVVDSQKNDMIRGNRFRLGLSLYLK